jgi:hypothetical protein
VAGCGVLSLGSWDEEGATEGKDEEQFIGALGGRYRTPVPQGLKLPQVTQAGWVVSASSFTSLLRIFSVSLLTPVSQASYGKGTIGGQENWTSCPDRPLLSM